MTLILLLCAASHASTVEDVTQLQRIVVDRVVTPTTINELQHLVGASEGPISIGGGRFSMGGQIATDGALFVDMRELDEVISYAPKDKMITVQAGATWRDIQEHIDADDLSVSIMQSYANFTVGGSLSVNAHGRYVNRGPVVGSVNEIELLLADGTLVRASPDVRSELFYGAIGGYGGLGIITRATLQLEQNAAVRRDQEWMGAEAYRDWFDAEIADSNDAVFHNADLYPPEYDRLVAITYSATDEPVTVPDRLQPGGHSTWLDRTLYWAVTELPGGLWMRESVVDPLRLRNDTIVWRNYEASYNVYGLEPASRAEQTYVLQEYFVPVEAFETFIPAMAEIYDRYDVTVANISVRHAAADTNTYLSWAPTPSYAFVVYYKQGTSRADRLEVATWTRELIDAVIDVEGTYYLPYQIHGTDDQFHAAYPRARDLFALKAEVDPDYRFRNRLWDRYLPPEGVAEHRAVTERLAKRADLVRPEDQSLLTVAEWHIVYSADALAAFVADGNSPSMYPFFADIGQYWSIHSTTTKRAQQRHAPNSAYQQMLWFIGASHTIEQGVKGLWEHSIGRLTGPADTPEDAFQAELLADYAAFIHHTPWYDFDWAGRLEALGAVEGDGRAIRRHERWFVLQCELRLKTAWASFTRNQLLGDPAAATVFARLERVPEPIDGLAVVEVLEDESVLVEIDRYEPFSAAMKQLAAQGVRAWQISGNERIAVTVLAPPSWTPGDLAEEVGRWPLLNDPSRDRVALLLSVPTLSQTLPALSASTTLEHVYDY